MTSVLQFNAWNNYRCQATTAWLNPARITFIEPRFAARGRDEQVVGTRVHFGPEDVLDLVDQPQVVIARLEGRLPEPYHMLEDANGIDPEYEAFLADGVQKERW
jgi:hypothetical protein